MEDRRGHPEPDALLTSGQVARLLGVGPSTVKRWTDRGELVCAKTAGSHRRFAASEVESFARRNGIAVRPASGTSRSVVDASGTPTVQRWLALVLGDGTAYDVHAALMSE